MAAQMCHSYDVWLLPSATETETDARDVEKVIVAGSMGNYTFKRQAVEMQRSLQTSSFAKTWAAYINGNVVSKSAARLIRTFLHNIAGRSAGDDNEMEEGDRSDVDEEIPESPQQVWRWWVLAVLDSGGNAVSEVAGAAGLVYVSCEVHQRLNVKRYRA